MVERNHVLKMRLTTIPVHRSVNRRYWLLGFAFTALLLGTPGYADPVPITLDANDKWVTNVNAEFPVSDLTLNVRRFARLPQMGATVPRPLGVRTIPGDDRMFVVLGDQRGGKAQFDEHLLALAPDGSSASSIFAPRPSDLFNVRYDYATCCLEIRRLRDHASWHSHLM